MQPKVRIQTAQSLELMKQWHEMDAPPSWTAGPDSCAGLVSIDRRLQLHTAFFLLWLLFVLMHTLLT